MIGVLTIILIATIILMLYVLYQYIKVIFQLCETCKIEEFENNIINDDQNKIIIGNRSEEIEYLKKNITNITNELDRKNKEFILLKKQLEDKNININDVIETFAENIDIGSKNKLKLINNQLQICNIETSECKSNIVNTNLNDIIENEFNIILQEKLNKFINSDEFQRLIITNNQLNNKELPKVISDKVDLQDDNQPELFTDNKSIKKDNKQIEIKENFENNESSNPMTVESELLKLNEKIKEINRTHDTKILSIDDMINNIKNNLIVNDESKKIVLKGSKLYSCNKDSNITNETTLDEMSNNCMLINNTNEDINYSKTITEELSKNIEATKLKNEINAVENKVDSLKVSLKHNNAKDIPQLVNEKVENNFNKYKNTNDFTNEINTYIKKLETALTPVIKTEVIAELRRLFKEDQSKNNSNLDIYVANGKLFLKETSSGKQHEIVTK